MFRVEIVLFAEGMVNVFEKLFNGRQTMNLIHRHRIPRESQSKDRVDRVNESGRGAGNESEEAAGEKPLSRALPFLHGVD